MPLQEPIAASKMLGIHLVFLRFFLALMHQRILYRFDF